MIEQARATDGRPPHAGPGLGFDVANARGAPVVYITNNPAQNSLTLTITNRTGKTLTLKGGVPVPEEQITPNGPTSLYLTFGDLLNASQFKQMQVSASGWQGTYFAGKMVTSWALTPRTDLVLADRGTVSVTITDLIVSGEPRPGALTVDFYNVPGLTDDSSQHVLAVQTPPFEPRDLNLDVAFVGSNVVNVSRDPTNPIKNTLVLSIANPSPSTPLVPPTVPWGGNPPVFFLSFVYGTKQGYGALTTAQQGRNIRVDPIGKTPDGWTQERVDQESGPYWRLTPHQHEVLGTGTASRVGFTLSNIISEFEPETLPTSLYLQWAYVPDYNGGYRSLDIVKSLPTPGIIGFRSVTPSIVPAGSPVSLTWQTFAVARVQLSYKAGERAVVLDSATGAIGLNAESFSPTPAPMLDTMYSLDAFDAAGKKVDSWQVTVAVTHQPITMESFTASPRVNVDGTPTDVTLTWSVTPVEMVKSIEIEGHATVTGQTSYVVPRTLGTTPFSLRATGLGGDTQVAGTRIYSLRDYLIGRTFEVENYSGTTGAFGIKLRDSFSQVTIDRLEILSATEARYTVDNYVPPPIISAGIGGGGVGSGGGSWNPFGLKGYPKTFTGRYTLDGTTLRVTISVGTLEFTYLDNTYQGESLKFLNPPFNSEITWRSETLMRLRRA